MSDSVRICTTCVINEKVPSVTFNAHGVCSVCEDYGNNKQLYHSYFKTEKELDDLISKTKRESKGDYDALVLYSGGKDSTYVLYKISEKGLRVLAMTFDNNYIPQQCIDNIKGVCDALNVDLEVVKVDKHAMDQVFVESLKEKSTVCAGCFRGLTARSTEIAIQKGIPLVFTGLSRGQIFAKKVYQLMKRGITDPDKIDEMLMGFRKGFHISKDKTAQLLNDRALADETAFNKLHFIDYFRYCDVEKVDIIKLIETKAPFWKKPDNVGGCSSNCMINDVGIQVHIEQKGYHYYTFTVAWEILLGHITREMALEELQVATTEADQKRISSIRKTIGY